MNLVLPSECVPVFRDGRVEFAVDLRVYGLSAVQKTAYRLAARCTAVLGLATEHSVVVHLTFSQPTPETAALEVARVFYQELLDQELREKIAAETAPLRDLLLAHAYSRSRFPSDSGS